jgi:hypothetical protein
VWGIEHHVDFYGALGAEVVGGEAGVGPGFGVFDEAGVDGVLMADIELFEKSWSRDDVEVEVAILLERPLGTLLAYGDLQGLKGCCEWATLGFGKQDVDVAGHDDAGEDVEALAGACTVQGVLEEVAGFCAGQIGPVVVAAEVDRVILACGLVAFEAGWHGEILCEIG